MTFYFFQFTVSHKLQDFKSFCYLQHMLFALTFFSVEQAPNIQVIAKLREKATIN